jgi:hypothetical protein
MKNRFVRPVVEVLSILILLYTNLLMGQYVRANQVVGKSFWAVASGVVSVQNLAIGVVGAVVAFVLVEAVNRKS